MIKDQLVTIPASLIVQLLVPRGKRSDVHRHRAAPPAPLLDRRGQFRATLLGCGQFALNFNFVYGDDF